MISKDICSFNPLEVPHIGSAGYRVPKSSKPHLWSGAFLLAHRVGASITNGGCLALATSQRATAVINNDA